MEKTEIKAQIIEKAQEAANEIPLFQVVDAAHIAGREHLLSSFWHAFRHFKAGRTISSNFSLEVLLYAAGVRQIHQAISLLGIQDSTQAIGLIAGSPNLVKLQKNISSFINSIGAKRDDTVLEINPSKMKYLAKVLGTPNIPVDQATILRRVAETALLTTEKSNGFGMYHYS
ncbi:MAG: KEOPS complex subunit Cgi121 [Candidatus Hodarchaeota archaeon]